MKLNILFYISLPRLTCLSFSAHCRAPLGVAFKLRSRRNFSSENVDLHSDRIKKYIESLVQEFRVHSQKSDMGKFSDRHAELKPLFNIYEQKLNLLECIASLKELNSDSNDVELKKQIENERLEYVRRIEELDEQLLNQIIPHDSYDSHHKIIMEINAGVGGQEAMLFAQELFDMYSSYIDFKGWMLDDCHLERTDLGGLRQATLYVCGAEAYKYLKHEAGVHRVQRVPATEKSGRLHTSTVSITVLPEVEEVHIELLDKDLQIETKRASGAGGQHVNKTESAVRITHVPTGISVESQTDRSQIRNRKEAMNKLRAILVRNKIEEQIASTNSARKIQVKSNMRSEKVRTYNYNQDRITDHRISGNVHNLPGFFTGSELLDVLIKKLEKKRQKELLLQKMEGVGFEE